MTITTNRLEAFSDGVIAIIITIMVLELKVPHFEEEGSSPKLIEYLKKSLPYFIAYVFSFMMIGIFWFNHHHLFLLLKSTDDYLVWQNFVFLFFVSLIPFATGIVGTHFDVPWSPVIYGAVMFLATGSLIVMRQHSLRKSLLHKDQDKALTNQVHKVFLKGRKKAVIGAVIYLVAIPLSFVNVYVAYACFVVPPLLFFIPEGIDDEKLAERVDEKNS
jgi:uncharacterized membrane protein